MLLEGPCCWRTAGAAAAAPRPATSSATSRQGSSCCRHCARLLSAARALPALLAHSPISGAAGAAERARSPQLERGMAGPRGMRFRSGRRRGGRRPGRPPRRPGSARDGPRGSRPARRARRSRAASAASSSTGSGCSSTTSGDGLPAAAMPVAQARDAGRQHLGMRAGRHPAVAEARRARRIACGGAPPTMIGGRGGRGRNRNLWPLASTSSPAKHACRKASVASVSAPRRLGSTPSARNSFSIQPTPTPRISRPPDSSWIVATHFAVSSAGR